MKLDSKTIAGLPVKLGRDLMRHLNVSHIDAESVLYFLNTEHWRSTVDTACKANPKMPKSLRSRIDAENHKEYSKIWGFKFKPIKLSQAERVFAALLAEDYLEPNEPEYPNDKRRYQLSQKGRQTAAANLTKRFDRAKADKEIAELILRANEINARDELVFYVHKITAFGSYLTDRNDLGDIDLVVELAPRREKHTDECHYRGKNSGKQLDFFARLNYGDREVLQILRARKARLSFCTRPTFETEMRVLFEWLPDDKRHAEMRSFDWRLHEPLRQVNEWIAANRGINTDPVEAAQWCQDVATMLKGTNRQFRLFHDWSDNAAHELMEYWGISISQAVAEKAHRMCSDEYRQRVSFYITHSYEKPVSTEIDEEIYAHFAQDTEHMDAAILMAKKFGWELARNLDGWVSPLELRIKEIQESYNEHE